MNEKIKELLTPLLLEWGGASDDNFSKELDKFVELIVKECYKIAMKEGNGFYCPSDILDNFGIEK